MIGIIILNYNNIEDTANCVGSVRKYCRQEDFALCVVDNMSRADVVDGVRQVLSVMDGFTELNVGDKVPSALPPVTYITNKVNGGYARGNNVGLEYFKHFEAVDYYMILNSDVIFTEDILTPLCAYLQQHPDVGVVSPLLYSRTGDIDYNCARHEKRAFDLFIRTMPIARIAMMWPFKKRSQRSKILIENPALIGSREVDIELPSGSCMLFPRKVFEEVGFFDNATFLYFEEDIIWCKLKKLGYRSVLLPSLSCIHLGASSISKSPSKAMHKAYTDSLIYYMQEYTDYSNLFVSLLKINISISRLKFYIKR